MRACVCGVCARVIVLVIYIYIYVYVCVCVCVCVCVRVSVFLDLKNIGIDIKFMVIGALRAI